MNKLEILSPSGAKKGILELPEIFRGKINMPLLSQAIYIYQDIRHPKLAKTKTRSEVNISTRKIYRQKGTGGARHGAKSAPIFVGGGVTHGPKGVKRLLKLPAKFVKKALQSALLSKLEKNQIKIVEDLSSVNKTKEASVIISKIVDPKIKKITVILPTQKSDAMRFWRNIAGVNVVLYKNLNAYLAYFGGTLLFDSRVFGVNRKASAKNKTVKKTTVAKKQ